LDKYDLSVAIFFKYGLMLMPKPAIEINSFEKNQKLPKLGVQSGSFGH
jgi:hypothetical protein